MALLDTSSGQYGWLPSRPYLPLSRIGKLLHAWRLAYEKRRTERLLEALPYDVRKDLGWPDSDGITKASR
ncbi:hypothetical protein [Rhizobium oryzicola]|uniref:DUF1127 domain-containing protein n=1 Tax=Rhizobium oryzicola TaxID=1232668 RepID=A0ABT8T173_9HYPH|nr:hypothetical protein [Rhizobium oryzicola]MDO1584386.1 hypothetical protein [Rhizobium oryzicola]